MSNPFTGYNSNQRVIALPPTPTTYRTFWNGADVTIGDLLVSAANLNAGSAVAFIYALFISGRPVAGVTAATVVIIANVLDGGGGVLFSASPLVVNVAQNGTTGTESPVVVAPAVPVVVPLTIGPTAVKVRFLANVPNLIGAPQLDIILLASLDPTNTGQAGTYGGWNMSAANAGTNPNTY